MMTIDEAIELEESMTRALAMRVIAEHTFIGVAWEEFTQLYGERAEYTALEVYGYLGY